MTIDVTTLLRQSEGLRSISDIQDYLATPEHRPSYHTVRRMIVERGLPATKVGRGIWFTTKSLVNNWIIATHTAEMKAIARLRLNKLEERDNPG